jgi:GAF domain-containing protein
VQTLSVDAMTEFGKQYLPHWIRGRLLLTGAALLIVLAVGVTSPTASAGVLVLLLAANLLLSMVLGVLVARHGVPALYAAFFIDILAIAIVVQYTNGVSGGFAAAYLLVVLNSILLLGREAFLRVAGMILCALLVLVGLEVLGVKSAGVNLPPMVLLLGQVVLLVTLLYTAYLISRTNSVVVEQWRGEKQVAETGRASAEREQQRWALINKVALRVQESTTPQEVYGSVGEELERVELHCAILEWAEPGVSFRIAHLSPGSRLVEMAREELKVELADVRLVVGDTPELERAVTTRTPILVENVLETSFRAFPNIPRPLMQWALARVDARTMLYAPMLYRESVSGALLIWGKALEESDLPPLAALAQQAASALDKARLLTIQNKRAAQLALVGEIAARAAVFSDPDAILRTMVQLVQERFGYHHVCVSLYDAARNEMEQGAVAGPNAHRFRADARWDARTGVIGLAARTRETVYSPDLQNDPRATRDPDAVAHSALCVPLVSGTKVLGVLHIESDALHAFDETDSRAMERLANQMAAALEKARSLEVERRRAAQLALVNRIASRTARLIPTEQLVHEATELIQTQFGYFNVAVFVRDEGQPGVRLVANAGAIKEILSEGTIRLTGGIIYYVSESGNSYLCTDTHTDPHYVSPYPDRADDPVESEIAIPLRRGDHIIGVLDIQTKEPRAFTPSDITALEALADQLAAALENARLFESEARRVAQLDAMRVLALTLTAERDLDVLLESIVMGAAELTQAQGAALYLVDETRGDLVARISHRLPRNYVGYRLPLGEGLAGRIARDGEPMMLANYATWDHRAAVYEGDPPARVLGVPLKWQDRVLGVINLLREMDRPLFTQEELRLANLFATQAAIAMENARLVSALQRRVRAQQAHSDLSATLLETTDPQAIIERATTAATRALETEIASLFLQDETGMLAVKGHAGPVPPQLLKVRIAPDSNSVTATVFRTRAPFAWSASDPASTQTVLPLTKLAGFHAGLAVPMTVSEQVVGVITVNTHGERQFDDADTQTLQLLANQTASALERARYFEQVQRRANELDLLFEGFRATASTLDPDEVITRLMEQLVRALDVTSAYFIQPHPSRAQWQQTHEYLAPAAHAGERTSDVRAWDTEALSALLDVLAQGVQVAQQSETALAGPLREYMRAHRVHTILRIPLRASAELIGYVSLWETRAPRHWTGDEIRFVQTMASQAAAALINARLYQAAQTRTRELHALHEASRLLNASLDVQTICETSVDSLRDILGYHHVSIYFVEGGALQMQVQRGYDSPFHVLQLDRGIIARAVQTREVVFLPDVDEEPGYLAALSNAQSEIALPLMAGERVLGVLNVETLQGEALTSGRPELTESDVQLLKTFANQLTVAMENARLFQETQQQLVRVHTLHAAAQAVNADLQLEAVLEQVVDQFIAALDVDSCTISEFDGSRHEAITLLDRDPLPEAHAPVGSRFPMSATEIELMVHSHGTAHAFRGDDPGLNGDIQALLARFAWRAVVIAPLIAKGEALGYVELGERKRERTFDADELRLAESLANQAAIAIQNARLYGDAQQRLQETETLYRFARELGATLDIHTLGTRALEAASRLTAFDSGEVSLLRESDGALVPLVMTGMFPVVPEEAILPRGVGISGWVVEHGRAVRLGDVTRDPRYFPLSEDICSEICLPLRIGPRVIGVLNLEARAADAFDAHVEQLLTAFANQLAIAVENARLYEQVKRDAEVKATLLRELSHRVKNNLAAITSLLYMALDEPQETREQILNETLGRVQSMALAHALLARSGEARVNLLELGRQVLHDTVRNLVRPGIVVDTELDGHEVQVAARQTTTLALVLNELATNALRHGPDGAEISQLRLRFVVAREGQEVHFQLQDNGKGLTGAFELSANAGLGLNLVRTLVEKDLHGQFVLERQGLWTSANIRFQLEDTA